MSLLLDALKKAAEEKKKKTASSDTDTGITADHATTPEESDYDFDLRDDDTEINTVLKTEIPATDSNADDETQGIAVVDSDVDETESVFIVDTAGDTQLPSFDEDESILFTTQEERFLSNDDVSDFLGSPDSSSQENVSPTVPEGDEDLSLSLVDADDVLDETVDAANSATQTLGTNVEMLGSSVKTDHLELVDHDRLPDEKVDTITQPPEVTVTEGFELESLRNENTIIRRDATSTHTYAPDNYDRTLIRTAEDASKIFAGMKAEEDVLITPDYAKRVFLSKSSANRAQYYRIYLGVGLSILLGIGIYALFELQDEYDRVDSALMPLKRDPMPGIIKSAGMDTGAGMPKESVEFQIDSQTLKLIENAALEAPIAGEAEEPGENEIRVDVSVAGAGSMLASADVVKTDEVVVESIKAPVTNEFSKQAPKQNVAVITVNKTQQNKKEIANLNSEKPSASIKITTDSRVSEKDRWLVDAYAAYQRGDDQTALEKYNKVLKVDPLNRNALLARAAIAIQNGDVASAIVDYQLLLTQNPKDSLAMSSLISVTNFSPQESETQLKLMIRDEPESPYLNFVLANIYGAQNRWQEAQSFYFKALKNNPEDPNYAYNLAISLEHISKPKVAIAYYERALSNITKGLATFDKDVVSLRLNMLKNL